MDPPSPSPSRHTHPPRRSQECAPMERWPAGRLQSGMSPTSVAGQGGQRAFRSAYPLRAQQPPSPPLRESALGTPWRQMTGPEDPGRAGSGAMGRAAMRTARFQGFDPTDSGRDPGLRGSLGPGFTCARLTTAAQLVPNPVPGSSAALMEQQPEPLASAAPAATGPAPATAATPLTTAAPTPPTTETRGSLGGSAVALQAPRAHCPQETAHWSTELLLSVKAGTLRQTIGYF